jgi:5-methylcytosine-specific restriction protein A
MAVEVREGQKGRKLNAQWNIGARHALFHEEGKWFHRLRRFPGALVDKTGFVLFETEEQFLTARGLQIKKDVFCPRGISRLPNYKTFDSHNAQRVTRALNEYASGKRPWREIHRDWYVISSGGELYPAKYIWALATDREPKRFHTEEARQALVAAGMAVVDKRQVREATSEDFRERVDRASLLSDEELQARAAKGPEQPNARIVAVRTFVRNEYVAAAALRRANGKCEMCGKPAPFMAKASGAPFLEIHHNVRLADGGADTLENTVAVCPNCHRRAHYG